MGSNISNEVRPLFDRPEVIPTIPDWDGNPMSIISVPVKIEAKISSDGSIATNINSILNTIIAENTAGAGYRLVSIFLPYWPGSYSQKIWAGYSTCWPQPIEYDYGDNWFTPKYIKAMCIFQKDPFFFLGKTHMYFSTVQMKLTQACQQQSEGHEKIYNQLVGAGQSTSYSYRFINDVKKLKCC